jgi:hypothetical protein
MNAMKKQPIVRPPSRRAPAECSPSISSRDASLKMLCIMWGNRQVGLNLFEIWAFPFWRQQIATRNTRPPNALAFVFDIPRR